MSLNNQSKRLADLGRREDALTAIEEAVTIRRDLARGRPTRFASNLAGSLENQGAVSAMTRAISAASAPSARGRTTSKRPVSGSISLTGSQLSSVCIASVLVPAAGYRGPDRTGCGDLAAWARSASSRSKRSAASQNGM
jgi:hypothetical protein